MVNVWSARTGAGLDDDFAAFSSSIEEDAAFLGHDITGSIAHVKGLAHAGIIHDVEANILIVGLNSLLADFRAGHWTLDAALEDVHMNIESALATRIGGVANKLHTGRSRNDQVATCITLFARERLTQLGEAVLGISHALSQQAAKHAKTPWVARTHGQPAQPATLGFLLGAHAWRFADVAQHIFWTARQVAVSPLGSGAVAGSTLPLDPEFTAQEMQLAAPRNALLATGTRDTVLSVLRITTQIGGVMSSLSEDLFQLCSKGAVTFDAGLMTGSSLMPQKRNPDAVELVRGQARAIAGHEAAVQSICTPLGLGYVRDLQWTKPHLLAATTEAGACLNILHACIDSLTVDAAPLAQEMGLPGIGATDAVEALVGHGMPFRTAYKLLAEAHATTDPAAFLEAADLEVNAKAACIAALAGDPDLRDTVGGPAPVAVAASLQHLDVVLATLEAQKDALQTAITTAMAVAA